MGNGRRRARLFIEQDMAESEIHWVAGGLAAVFSAAAPDKQTPNEDAAAVIPFLPESSALVVADGMGGGPAGERAASLAVRAMKSSLDRAADDPTTLRGAILNGFERANQQVLEIGGGAATTLAVVEIQDASVRPYHVGDSMIVVVGQRGKVKLKTVSHSPVGYAVEAGLMEESEALQHEDRHLVSNMIGAPDMRIEIGPTLKLAPYDTLLLASDGLFDNLFVGEIVEYLRAGPLAEAARALAEAARRRMESDDEGHPSKPDDLTFVAFRRRSGD